VDAEKPLWEGHRLLQEVDWGAEVRIPGGSTGCGRVSDPKR